MAEHDLSALDGLLDELDIEEKGNEDPRAAKLKALFEKAKAEYTAKIDVPTWYISPHASSAPFNVDKFNIPSPKELLARRKADRTGSTNQEWTVNYLYNRGHFELCLSYVASFAVSMGIEFPFDAAVGERLIQEHDSSQSALRRTKQERELSKNWGIIKDVIDAGVRSLLTLLRTTSTSATIDAWVPHSTSGSDYQLGKVRLEVLASGFLTFCMREIRVGAGDSRSGYSGMIVSPAGGDKKQVDMENVRLQNWTVTHGLALTAGDLALELELYRTAIEAHTLFLACRGQMWRVLLALAHELSCYHQQLNKQGKADAETRESLCIVAKAAIVSALQAVPRPRRLEIANSILIQHRVIPAAWIEEVLHPDYVQPLSFKDEDELLFYGLLQYLDPQADAPGGYILPEEIGIALVKVIFAKKSGLLAIYSKFPAYMREYTQRLSDAAANTESEWAGDLDAADEEDAENGPRSVRTL
ncbi:uncharacterized protein SPSC_02953 [Sporisorium scitamineum]|uniref:Uncharacterized protein n=1 Tax=Sporisorium scitamineum TaxID=49012 RepID=A0A0F7RWU7_9BASI|nr:hypothetical protein [Sporisorium scitamineum]CDS82133.1 uncharacterized protein SPSC_02953 [Sporisorium scitamineum]